MFSTEELEVFEKKLVKEGDYPQGSKILIDMMRRIKASNSKNDINGWSDYGAWDNWDRS